MKKITAFILAMVLMFSLCSCMNKTEEPTAPTESEVTPAESEPVTEEEEVVVPDTFTVQLAGDFLIHGTLFRNANTGKDTYNFLPFVSLFDNVFVSDLNVLNLENPVDAKGDNKGISNYPSFNAPIECLDAVKKLNIDVCITANNHAADQRFEGLVKSLENVKSKGFDAIGTYANEADSQVPYVRDVNGMKVGIVPVTAHVNGWKPGGKNDFAISVMGGKLEDVEKITEKINKVKEAGAEFVIVSIHWGTEYVDAPSNRQKQIAHALVENGADVIMGSHSHCVQPIEVVDVKRNGEDAKALIMYSVGNFFANQTGLNEPKTQGGMVVTIKASKKESGNVTLDEAFYMPTYTFETGGTGADFFRLIPSGKYALAEERPEIFENDRRWKLCKNSWEHVTEVAGDAIPHIASPEEYPEGFFDYAR